MAQIRIFSNTLNGFIEFTGNTPGITTVSSTAVIAIDALIQAGPVPPAATTIPLTSWPTASTAAFLTGLSGSSVVKAYLSWYGQPVPDTNGTSAGRNNPVTFTDPTGTSRSISPNPAWTQDAPFGGLVWSTRVADVTDIVTSAGTGKYTVAGIPSGANFTGWTLAVVWRNTSLPPRFISIDSYDDINNNSPLNLTIAGFITPASGTVTGRVALAVSGAESNSAGGGVLFGSNLASLTTLSGPNNPASNFFQCQINDSNSESATVGQLDTTGTYGNKNTPINSNPVADTRWHFDQTNVSINSGLTNSQTSGTFQFGAAPSPYIVNQISLQIDAQAATLIPTKSVDKPFAEVGEILTYTLVIRNTGNNASNNCIVIDTIPSNTTFIPSTVYVNGANQPAATSPLPPNGFDAGPLAVGATNTVTFQVKVNNAAVGTSLPNSYYTSYSYTPINANTITLSANASSNTVLTTIVATATITSTKTVTPTNTLVGDTLNYTIVLKNIGTTTANNLVFTDTMPNGTSFIPGTLKINNNINPGNPSPPTGVTLPDLGVNSVATVTFSVNIDTIPSPNPTQNSSTTNFSYTPTTITGTTVASGSNSNIATAFVNPDSNLLKTVDKAYATVGDTLKYTLVWKNVISVAESNVTFVDTIPSGTTFVPGSITITGGSQTGTTITPPNGLNVGTVPVGSTVTVTFNVTVNTIPTVNPIPNSATAGYNFVSDPTLGTVKHDTSLSNTVTTQVNLATISSATKTVDKAFAKVGDILEYTVVFRNTGNVTANNIVLIDTIPNGTSFVINSVKIDEVTQPGAVVAPTTGLSVGTLASGVTTTVKFQVTVITIPTTNPIPNTAAVGYNFQVDPVQNINKGAQINTNTVNTRVNFADITSPVKTVNKAYANVGDTLVYTIVLRNTGNVTATNIVFIDTIPNDTTLVSNTFKQDSTNITGSPNPPGVTLPNSLPPGATTTVTFNVKVNTIPNPNPISNNASSQYSYLVDPTLNTTAIGSGNTNTVVTTVNNANLGNIYKSVDKFYSTCGDILTYTITIPNGGNTAAFNVVLRDTIPNGTSLVANSVTVNSVTQPSGTNPQTGITVGTIASGSIATVTFQVKVNC